MRLSRRPLLRPARCAAAPAAIPTAAPPPAAPPPAARSTSGCAESAARHPLRRRGCGVWWSGSRRVAALHGRRLVQRLSPRACGVPGSMAPAAACPRLPWGRGLLLQLLILPAPAITGTAPCRFAASANSIHFKRRCVFIAAVKICVWCRLCGDRSSPFVLYLSRVQRVGRLGASHRAELVTRSLEELAHLPRPPRRAAAAARGAAAAGPL